MSLSTITGLTRFKGHTILRGVCADLELLRSTENLCVDLNVNSKFSTCKVREKINLHSLGTQFFLGLF